MTHVYQRHIEGICTIDQLVLDWATTVTQLAKNLSLSITTLKKWDTRTLSTQPKDREITYLLEDCYVAMIEDGLR